ncbi:hypothetical protein JZ751_002876 [Albula glossodonta]|uniref:Uncharacterized protein n=1 Tax=Albula glossodonta TaxID=121402 RepID=A0A8T2N847_9TELE|nr:hypothetical protein JZ751_002876 [Albula glossodonta]
MVEYEGYWVFGWESGAGPDPGLTLVGGLGVRFASKRLGGWRGGGGCWLRETGPTVDETALALELITGATVTHSPEMEEGRMKGRGKNGDKGSKR